MGCHGKLHKGFWHHAKIQRNLMIHSKKIPRQMSGGKDGKTLFHRILPATAWDLTSTTAVDWHLNVKDTEYVVGLTKTYCITISMQKISSIHKLITQILEYHVLKMTKSIFDHTHPKIIKITFSFHEFPPVCKKSVHSINSFLRHNFRVQWPDRPLISDHTHPKMFWSTSFNLCEFASTYKKIRLFHWFVLEIGLIKKSRNLIGWKYFDPHLWNKRFPKYGICARTQQMV